MRNVFISIVYILVATPLFASPVCEQRDISGAITEEERFALKLLENEWMRNATICKMGSFEIATPTNNTELNQNIIFIFKKGKPVFYRKNTSTYVYSPNLKDASLDKVLVNIWHGADDGDIERLWYETVGNDPQVMIYDINFDGQPDFKSISKNNEIIEMYEWKNNSWAITTSDKTPSNKPIKPTR